jgi:hypothetical protein
VEYAEYALLTDAGPIVVHVVAAAPHRSDLRIESALASDALTSGGETTTSMARRTGAVAGINADYFDIGNTNAPTNIVVRGGTILRSPRKRYALLITKSGMPQIAEASFVGQATLGDKTISLDAINELPPPDGGTTLVTPDFGAVPPLSNVTLVALTLRSGTPPFAQYAVQSIADNSTRQAAGFYLAIGLNAYGRVGVPNPGDTLAASGDLSPVAISEVEAAVGGGPLILHNGSWNADPDGPNGGEYAARIPSSGAGIASDGTLYLIEVDGRQSDFSVGVTRPEFSALMRSFGASEGLAFDGGGSSALAARTLGDATARLVTSPSDGVERKIADGIYIYSTAPIGAAAQLVAQPSVIRALPGASVGVRLAALDASAHVVSDVSPTVTVEPASIGTYRDGTFSAQAAGTGFLIARGGSLETRVPIEVRAEPAKLTITPEHGALEEHGRLTLHARAFDPRGFDVALPSTLPWRTSSGSIDASGVLVVGTQNAVVSLLIGNHLASAGVMVGSRDALMHLDGSHFMTTPRGGDGAVGLSTECQNCFELLYHLRGGTRAAYFVREQPLPIGTVALRFDVRSDGSGARLKVALRNAINEEVLLPAMTLDAPGWRHISVPLPQNFASPGRFVALYVIAPGGADLDGSLLFKSFTAAVAGSP